MCAIAKKVGVPYRRLFRYIAENRPMPLDVLRLIVEEITPDRKSHDAVMESIYQLKLTFKTFASSSNEVSLPKFYDERLCYLLGVLHDGTVYADENKNQYVLQFWQKTDRALMSLAADYIEDIFRIRPKEYGEYIQLSSKVVVEFFRTVMKIPRRHKEWSSFLMKELPWQLKKYQIAGFYDAEGWCGGKSDPRIKFSQKSSRKLSEIKTVLEEHGIKCGEVCAERNIHVLYISDFNSCVKFAEEIARVSRHSQKSAKLSELLEYVGRPPLIRGT
ncbi:MAG: LAGLIDADG family homing endonuclease [Candidatus Hadarchaeales archaeon]